MDQLCGEEKRHSCVTWLGNKATMDFKQETSAQSASWFFTWGTLDFFSFFLQQFPATTSIKESVWIVVLPSWPLSGRMRAFHCASMGDPQPHNSSAWSRGVNSCLQRLLFLESCLGEVYNSESFSAYFGSYKLLHAPLSVEHWSNPLKQCRESQKSTRMHIFLLRRQKIRGGDTKHPAGKIK